MTEGEVVRETWYILKSQIDRPWYAAHSDPQCSHLKLKDNPRKLYFVVRSRLGVHVPCQRCGGVARERWDAAWDSYFHGHITDVEMHTIRSEIRKA